MCQYANTGTPTVLITTSRSTQAPSSICSTESLAQFHESYKWGSVRREEPPGSLRNVGVVARTMMPAFTGGGAPSLLAIGLRDL